MRGTLTILLTAALAAENLFAQQSKGTLGIEAAKGGGVILACRHGITGPTDEDERTLKYDDPSTQRRLSQTGERQAENLGKAMRELRIPIGEIIASPMQRARRTAELAFGTPRLDSTWHTRGDNYETKRQPRLAILGQPVDGGNRVIVSHVGTLMSVIPSARVIEEGDCVVLRPMGGAQHEVIEVVPWRAWLRAAHLDDSDRQS